MTTMAPRRRQSPSKQEAVALLPEALVTDDLTVEAAEPSTRRIPVPRWLRSGSSTLTLLGVAVAAVGFVLLAVGWGQVAGEADVFLQLPYLVSAGFTGMGLVLVGLTVVNVSTRQRDAAERRRQLEQLAVVLEQLGVALDQGRDR